ncbi:peptidase family A16, partial [Oesophagostomum dentatum]
MCNNDKLFTSKSITSIAIITAYQVTNWYKYPIKGSNPLLQLLKLPKFKLPTLHGEAELFPEFWDVYTTAVHMNPTVPVIMKFLHLKNYLKGNAALVIHGLTITEQNYNTAIQMLHQHYHRPRLTRNTLVNKLTLLKPASNSVVSQRNTLCVIKSIMAQLSKLEESSQATTTMQIIRSKFPKRTRMRLAKRQHQHGSDWEVPHLFNALDSIIEELEAVSDFEQPQLDHVKTTLTAHTQRYSPNPYSKRSYAASTQHPPSLKNR